MDEELLKKIEDCPIGATHYTALFDGSNVTFWKKAISGYGVESGEPFRDWYSWAGDDWQKETSVRTTHFKEIPKELQKEYPKIKIKM